MSDPYISIGVERIKLPGDVELGDEFGFTATLKVVAVKKRVGGEVVSIDVDLVDVSLTGRLGDA